ncbi:YihY/virulence factor BrkB family protein [Anaerofustis sp.]|uniref:YihY/virulence factor BrkB family protein n=1 Tax=Anaerofustis sp. TaxID=1872517 RepID=UPI0025C26803|nr:YihY/virulence factor BrkB family protein [Anaerofustis sp.]
MNFYQFLKDIKGFFDKLSKDYIYTFAAQTAFFMMFSFIPLIMIIVLLVQYLPLTQEELISISMHIFPHALSGFINNLLKGLYINYSGTVLAITFITLLWSASKGIYAISKGLNTIYRTEDSRNYIYIRGISLIYTICFGLIFLTIIILLIFGINIVKFLESKLFFIGSFHINYSYIGGFLLLCIIFLIMFCFLPKRKFKILKELPGAIFSAAGWIIFSFLYSLYITKVGANSLIYGSLSAVILFMLWLYFCMYIIFLGGEINVIFQNYNIRKKIKLWFTKPRKKATLKDYIKLLF